MKKILLYILITFGFSWILWGLQYLGQENYLPEWVQLFGMFALFGPLVGFMFMVKHEGKSIKITFKNMFTKAPIWTYIFVLLVPMILSGFAYYVYVDTATGTYEPIALSFSTILTAIMILFVGGPVEEFGWRGYLLPKLRNRYAVISSIFILGLIHGIWHLPLHFLNGTVQSAIPIYEFLIITVFMTTLYVFIYEFTKSIIPMILLHWFANLSSAIFPYYYSTMGRYALLGITLNLNLVLLIILYKQKRTL